MVGQLQGGISGFLGKMSEFGKEGQTLGKAWAWEGILGTAASLFSRSGSYRPTH